MDEQAAVEATLSVIMAKFSGGNLIHDVGYMESGLTTSYEMIALTDELVAMTDNMVKGIEVNDETLLVDEIDRVGPGGNYLDSKATLKRFREYWRPGLLDRRLRQQWLDKGSLTLGQRLTAKVVKILDEYRPKELEAEKSRKLREIIAQVK